MTAETLKEELLTHLDAEKNVINIVGATEAISGLEQMSLTKEALETTRLGMLVNLVRKQNATRHPDLSKRCKNLIREWQKLVNPESSGSTGGTCGSSPAGFGSGLTPRLNPLTPGGLISRLGGATPSPSSSHGRVLTPVQKPSGPPLSLHKSATTVDLSATQSTPSLKMKIKVGGPHPMVTTVSYPSPNLPVLQNGTGGHQLDAESKLSRKRKLATTDDNSDSLHGAPVAKKLLNGANVANLHKSCSTEVLMELDGTKDQRQKRPTSVGSTSLPGSDPELDQNIYVVPGRMPKVKTTLEIVAGMTGVAQGANNNESIDKPVVLGCGDDFHATLEDLKDSRQRQRGRRKKSDELSGATLPVMMPNGEEKSNSPASLIQEFSREPLAQVKNDLVRRFLDTSVSPQALTPTSLHSGSPLDGTKLEAIKAETDSNAVSTAQSSQNVPIAIEGGKLEKMKMAASRKKVELHNWYSILPPLQNVEENGQAELTESSAASAPTNSQVERNLTGTWPGVNGSFAGESFHDWRERFLLQPGEGRQFQSLPYADLGLPDFIQFELPAEWDRMVVGPNFFHADRLQQSSDDSPL